MAAVALIVLGTLALAGCAPTADTQTTQPHVEQPVPRAALDHAKARVGRMDRREIRLLKDRHMVGAPRMQTVRVKCPSKDAKAAGEGWRVACTATLYLPVAPDVAILDEKWRVDTDSAGEVTSAKPVHGYEIRAYFEADDSQDCSGALVGQSDLQAAVDALSPCLAD